MSVSRTWLESALAEYGLRLRGGWIPTVHDVLAPLPNARPAAVVWMVGQVGSECWAAFSRSPYPADGRPDPMDRWSKSIGNALALHGSGIAVYPSDGPPYAAFQQWARRAEPLQTSPLLLQLHPQWGLWHAYRFALLMPQCSDEDRQWIARSVALPAADLCSQCDGQPCLQACPVTAFAAQTYAVDVCAQHLHSGQGQECLSLGCLARSACPVGAVYRYAPEHAAFHMRAFARRH